MQTGRDSTGTCVAREKANYLQISGVPSHLPPFQAHAGASPSAMTPQNFLDLLKKQFPR